VNLDRVERVLRLFDRSRAQELRVAANDWRITLRRGSGSGAGAALSPAGLAGESLAALPTAEAGTIRITAPLVGIFRRGERHLAVGDRIEAGTPVGAIESMKILSPVFAESDGQIEEVLVEDGHPVEYGEPLFVLRPCEAPEEQEEEQ
jgi:biotin carboxyl carrier protein